MVSPLPYSLKIMVTILPTGIENINTKIPKSISDEKSPRNRKAAARGATSNFTAQKKYILADEKIFRKGIFPMEIPITIIERGIVALPI